MTPQQSAADMQRERQDVSLSGRRVLFIAPQPFYEDRGSPIAVLQVLRALSQLGVHVDLLAFPSDQSVEIENLRIFRYGKALGIRNVPIGFSLKKVILDLALMRGLRSHLKSEQYECIHALEDGIYVTMAVRATAKIPIIYDMHSCIPEQLSGHALFGNRIAQVFLKKMERRALERSSVVSCSVGLKDYINSVVPDVPVIEWPFSEQHSAIDASTLDRQAATLRSELGIDTTASVILYAGNFAEYQGVDMLIDAIPAIREVHPNAVLVLLGASQSDNAEELENRGNGSIIVCPRQPHASVGKYLHMAQILVSPRKWGGNLPLKLFEYLAAGKPIVATDNEHHRMLLDDDRAVLAENSAAGLAGAISGLLDDPNKMRHLAAKAREYSEKELGWARFVDTVTALYQSALRQRSP